MSSSDRRSFLKQGAAGLAALGGIAQAGCGAEPATPVDVRRGALEGVLQPELVNLGRFVMARTNLPVAVWDDALAAAKLAADMVEDGAGAAQFHADPKAYMAANGLAHVELDPGSVELKLALALGDPNIREFVKRRDIPAFLDCLDRCGLLGGFQRSALAERLQAPISLRPSNFDLSYDVGGGGGGGGAVYAVAILLVAAVVTWVAVAYSVTVTIMVGASVALSTSVTVSGSKMDTDLSALYRRVPGLALAEAIGGPDASIASVAALTDETLESVATSLEQSQVYLNRGGPTGTALRDLIRQHMSALLSLPA